MHVVSSLGFCLFLVVNLVKTLQKYIERERERVHNIVPKNHPTKIQGNCTINESI